MDDALVAEALVRPGCRLGREVIVKRLTGSTNDDARALAESGAAHGTVVIAERQERGRGRLGRSWHSPEGRSLLFSVVLKEDLPREKVGLVTIAAGVAVARSLRDLCGIEAGIKWPNDVRVNGRKLAGILAEAAPGMEYVILGIGVNVNLKKEELAAEIRDTASSILIETEKNWDRARVFHSVMEHLERVFSKLERGEADAVLDAWCGLSEVMGRQVRVETPQGTFTGSVTGIRDDGALLIREPEGAEMAVMAGDVIIIGGREKGGQDASGP